MWPRCLQIHTGTELCKYETQYYVILGKCHLGVSVSYLFLNLEDEATSLAS